jgi:hypothetical protein
MATPKADRDRASVSYASFGLRRRAMISGRIVVVGYGEPRGANRS